MEYKIGDTVRVIDVDEAVELLGLTGTVVSVDDPEGCSSPDGHGWVTVHFASLRAGKYPLDNKGNTMLQREELQPVP